MVLFHLSILPALFHQPLALTFVDGKDDGPQLVDADRPSAADGTGIIPLGHTQIEMGLTRTQVDHDQVWTFGEAIVRQPVRKDLEVRIAVPTYTTFTDGTGKGWQDGGIGVKWQFQPGGEGKTELALLAQTTLPSGSSAFRSKVAQPSLRLAAQRDLGKDHTVFSELVYSRLNDGAGFDQWFASVGISWLAGPKVGPYVELYGQNNEGRGTNGAAFINAGASFWINNSSSWDVRIGTGLAQKRDGWFVGTGYTVRF